MPYLQEDSQAYHPGGNSGMLWVWMLVFGVVGFVIAGYFPRPYRPMIEAAIIMFAGSSAPWSHDTPRRSLLFRLAFSMVFGIVFTLYSTWAMVNPERLIYSGLAICGVMFLAAVLKERKRQRQQY